MKTFFSEYYRATDEETSALWSSCTFIIDTNALLDVYRYSEPTANAFMSTLQTIKDRLWIPHQVGSEYHKSLIGVLLQAAVECRDALTQLEKLTQQIATTSEQRRIRPHLKPETVTAFNTLAQRLRNEIEDEEKTILNQITTHPRREEISSLFADRVGAPTPAETLQKWCAEGAVRYARHQPPGFADAKKPEPDRYGHLILWKQLIEYAKTQNADVIFITNDTKEDWTLERGGRKFGPHPELMAEFKRETGGRFYSHNVAQFLSLSNKYFKTNTSQAAITEAAEVYDKYREDRRNLNLMAWLPHRDALRSALHATSAFDDFRDHATAFSAWRDAENALPESAAKALYEMIEERQQKNEREEEIRRHFYEALQRLEETKRQLEDKSSNEPELKAGSNKKKKPDND